MNWHATLCIIIFAVTEVGGREGGTRAFHERFHVTGCNREDTIASDINSLASLAGALAKLRKPFNGIAFSNDEIILKNYVGVGKLFLK